MRFEVENIGAVKKKISVEIPAEAVNSEIEAAYNKLKNQVKMDGFRKGKVPRHILEKYYKGHVEYDAATKLINDSFNMAVSERSIFPVSEPEIEMESFAPGSVFRYTATVEVRPEIEVTGYEGLKLEKNRVLVTDAMVDERIEALRRQNLILNGVSRPVKDGDVAVIDFEGFMEGIPFKGGKGEGVPLKIGSGKFIPGFETQLTGMSAGDEKEIGVKFPDDYGSKELAGRDAVFRVKVREVKEEILSALDDDFAGGLGFGNMGELKAAVKTNIEKEEESRARAGLREKIVDALIKANPVEIPQSMIKKQKEFLMEDLKKRYGRAGLAIDDEIEKGGALSEKLEKSAIDQIKSALMLTQIAKKEELRVTEEEFDEKLTSIAVDNRVDVSALKDYYKKNNLMDGLRREILDDKVFELIIGRANVVEI